MAAVIDRVSSSKPSVSFRRLPRIQDPPTVVHDAKFLVRYLDLVSRYHQHLHDLLASMPPGSVHALVVDVLSIDVLDVTGKLGIPVYTFFPVSASVLAACVQVSSIRVQVDGGQQSSLQGLGDTPLLLHGVPPVPASHLSSEMLEHPSSEAYKAIMNMMRRIQEAKGILVNTFASLEHRAVEALSDPRCLPTMPSLYCVGPLVAEHGEATERHECLAWLDEQPEHSVVFLCFGSVGTGNHSKAQLKEIANGLEKSGHRFLWVVRAPPHDDDPGKPLDPRADTDLDAILPEGFLDRTHGRGLVVKLWAPQVDVLHHRATGAFVTHCGWNSVLEGITAGVPMICWPLYAEQKMNMVLMVVEYGVGVEMVGWKQGLVKAEEVEAKIRLVMESEEGEKLRAQVMAQKEAAAMAWKDDGSSRAAFGEFLLDTQAT
ncbi:hypothetical protein U9M48_044650 [Paspalum notatum var. saurae]|uniref:Glycosyltransferase n=1 Tax=Paspalum notatum var. saurae TaxID=547442 RepID=A0AAQ3UVH6_PASNO